MNLGWGVTDGPGWPMSSCCQLLETIKLGICCDPLKCWYCLLFLLQLLSMSWVEVEPYYNMFSLLLHLVKHPTCWSEISPENHQKAKRSRPKGSKHWGNFSGRLCRKVGRSVIPAVLAAGSFPSLENAEKEGPEQFPSLLGLLTSPFCSSVLTSLLSLSFFWFVCLFVYVKFRVTYCKKELLKLPLGNDGLTSSALCKVCEGIQLSQITMPKCAFSKAVSHSSECETGRQSEEFPAEWGIVELLCARSRGEQPWDQQNKTEQVLAVPAKHFSILMDFRLILKFFQQHMFKLCMHTNTQFGLLKKPLNQQFWYEEKRNKEKTKQAFDSPHSDVWRTGSREGASCHLVTGRLSCLKLSDNNKITWLSIQYKELSNG